MSDRKVKIEVESLNTKLLSRQESEEFSQSKVASIPSKLQKRSSSSISEIQETKTEDTESELLGPDSFDLLCVIGSGAFGKVIQVRHKPTGSIYAMKIVSKQYLVKKKSVPYMQAERDIMTKINHPFLVGLKFAFQTETKVYLVMPFIPGGELFHTLTKQGLLLEDTVKFYAAEMVLALDHLHQNGIIHRDLKPENILIDSQGHICITDFGLAKEMKNDEDSTTTICGTNEYMAPEMIRGNAYNQAVDWWALGALIYEMVTGYPPFRHKNKKKLHQKILNEKLHLPKWLRSETHSILKQLMDRNVEKRLGSGKSSMFKVRGVRAVKDHPFFKGIDWNLLEKRGVKPPIIPNIKDPLDTSCFSEEFTCMTPTDSIGSLTPVPRLFSRFSFIAQDAPPINEEETDAIHEKLDNIQI